MIQETLQYLEPQTQELFQHPLFTKLEEISPLRTFMEFDVFSGWEYMSLLTALQQQFTNTRNPWLPAGNPEVRFLIHKMLLKGEADVNLAGALQNPFEMYQEAMTRAGAETGRIRDFFFHVDHGTDIFLVIATSDLPLGLKAYLKNTFELIEDAQPHKIAAALSFGSLSPGIEKLPEILKKKGSHPELALFQYYLERQKKRHQALQPLSLDLVTNFCGNCPSKWQEVRSTAQNSLQDKIALYDTLEKEIDRNLITGHQR